ncbi:MAG: hypothetical protein ACD_84C00047G0002 [uncultured bacterium]|nr:MAG: hypothetical protein ACD_84C00047G0002 [uncultured bacterium]
MSNVEDLKLQVGACLRKIKILKAEFSEVISDTEAVLEKLTCAIGGDEVTNSLLSESATKIMERIAIESNLIGEKSFFIKWLHRSVVRNGQGLVDVCNKLPRFGADALTTPPHILINWPSGFYRNAATTDTQLLLRLNDRYAVCVDGLPGTNYQVSVFIFDTHISVLNNLASCSIEELKMIGDLIDVKFEDITESINK